MNYELAKELKDAGFPQNTNYATVQSPWYKDGRTEQRMAKENGNDGYANLLSAGYDVVSLPTLSELIEVCDWKFASLSAPDQTDEGGIQVWLAESRFPNIGSGSTPEEAVAKLWLALNKTV